MNKSQDPKTPNDSAPQKEKREREQKEQWEKEEREERERLEREREKTGAWPVKAPRPDETTEILPIPDLDRVTDEPKPGADPRRWPESDKA